MSVERECWNYDPSEVRLNVEESEQWVLLEPTEDLIAGGACDRIEVALLSLAEQGAQVVVDLSGVVHLTARSLGIFVQAHQIAAQHGGFIALCAPSPAHRWLLDKTGLASALPIHSDMAAAKEFAERFRRAVA